MTEDEIVYLTNSHYATSGEINDVIIFARAILAMPPRAIEHCTLTNQKAKWYQEGVEAEREACAEICELLKPSNPEFDRRFWDGCTESANAIRARRTHD